MARGGADEARTDRGLRRTTDALRAVLERTRGDMTAALRQEQLTAALAALEGRLGGVVEGEG